VADWLHRRVAGLGAAAPGYARLRIAPVPLEGLEHASVIHDTPYGRAESGWMEAGAGELRVRAVVPANTTAVVELPGQADVEADVEVGAGTHEWTIADPRRA